MSEPKNGGSRANHIMGRALVVARIETMTLSGPQSLMIPSEKRGVTHFGLRLKVSRVSVELRNICPDPKE